MNRFAALRWLVCVHTHSWLWVSEGKAESPHHCPPPVFRLSLNGNGLEWLTNGLSSFPAGMAALPHPTPPPWVLTD